MKALIVEDEVVTRRLIKHIISAYGDCDVATNGIEAIDLFKKALDEGSYYDLICLDIMMPEMNGQEVLKKIRDLEYEKEIYGLSGVKIIMITALGDTKNVLSSFREQCDVYIIKPIKKEKLLESMKKLGFID